MGSKEKLDPTAALWNRMAATGGRFLPSEEQDHYDRLDEKEEHAEPHVAGGIDLNPLSYVAAAGSGALGSIFGKVHEDIDSLQSQIPGKKKKKKKRVEAEPEAAPPEPQVIVDRRPMRTAIGALRGLKAPWYRRPWVPFAAAGAALVGVAAVALKR